jgi:hypothetical protein
MIKHNLKKKSTNNNLSKTLQIRIETKRLVFSRARPHPLRAPPRPAPHPLLACVSVLNECSKHLTFTSTASLPVPSALQIPDSAFWVAIEEGAGLLGRHGLVGGRI